MTAAAHSYGKYAASLREDRSISQQRLADLARVSIGAVQKIEAGKIVKPKTLEQIYRGALKITPGEWERLLVLWLLNQIKAKLPEESFAPAFAKFRSQESSDREQMVLRLEEALKQFTDEELSVYARFAELLNHDRFWLQWMRNFLEVHPKAPPVVASEPVAAPVEIQPVKYTPAPKARKKAR